MFCIFYFHIQPLPALNLDPSTSPSSPPKESPHTKTSMRNMTFLKMLLRKRWRSGSHPMRHLTSDIWPLIKPPLKFFSVLPQGSVTLPPPLFFSSDIQALPSAQLPSHTHCSAKDPLVNNPLIGTFVSRQLSDQLVCTWAYWGVGLTFQEESSNKRNSGEWNYFHIVL